MDTTGGSTTSGKMLISCSQSKLSRDRYFHLTPYLLQDVSLNWMIVCLIQIITRFCSNLLLTSERYQKYILLKNQKIYIILPISHRRDSDGLCLVNIENCLYFSRRLVTFCWKNFSDASSINHSPYFSWDFENKHFGNTFLNINEEDISKDILYITIKDLLYLSNSYDILEYRILYFIFCILSQFVLTLLQYYFSFFQANFPVSLSLPICRVLNPGKVHILYITFTHNILYMAKKMCACIDQGWGNPPSGKFCVRTKSIKP